MSFTAGWPGLACEFYDRRRSWRHLHTISLDGCITLLAAVVRQWLDDARRDPCELAGLAAWLGIDPQELARRLPTSTAERRAAGPVAPGHCEWCGQALVKPTRGRMGRFCGDKCRGIHSYYKGGGT